MTVLTIVQSPRSIQEFFARKGTDGVVVGPATYNAAGAEEGPRERPVPYAGTQKRPPITRWRTKLNPPGPGAYDIVRSASEPGSLGLSASRSSFRARGPRIKTVQIPGSTQHSPSRILENPGPGQYDVARNIGTANRAPIFAGRKAVSAVPVIGVDKSSPSIPPARDKELVRCTGCPENSLAPGDYDPDTDLRHIGPCADFHSCSSRRRVFEATIAIDNTMPAATNPGPGTYPVRQSTAKGTDQPFKSQSPQRAPVRSDVPGPGAYLHDADKTGDLGHRKSLALAGSRSTSRRISPEVWSQPELMRRSWRHLYEDPGPGTYPLPSDFPQGKVRRGRSTPSVLSRTFHAIPSPKQLAALRDCDGSPLCGFASTEQKESFRQLSEQGAAPGQYDHQEAMGQSMAFTVNQHARVGKLGVFGSTQKRFFRSSTGPVLGVPGPGEYGHLREKRAGRSTQPGQSPFKSKLPQRPAIQPVITQGDYDVTSVDGLGSRSPTRSSKQVTFGSCGSRWSVKEDSDTLPGPCEYDPKKVFSKSGGVAQVTAKRWRSSDNGIVGPGTYHREIPLDRRTFNVGADVATFRQQGFLVAEGTAAGGAGGGVAGTRKRLEFLALTDGFARHPKPSELAQSSESTAATQEETADAIASV
mmetsp:Transcript_33264/g.72601  ORF Transcript_33264/g.72601 Transcript_33264/m.72601 type:complete len:642 (-) Transcript_33264:137-2062(-)